jgi:predicted ATP-binding protein involved in virulence
MRVERLTLSNFRGFRSLELGFPRRATVLIGVNGAGKTAILDALATVLSELGDAFLRRPSPSRALLSGDLLNGAAAVEVAVSVTVAGAGMGWPVRAERYFADVVRGPASSVVADFVAAVGRAQVADPQLALPLALYFPTGRAFLDIPERIRTTHAFDQLAALDEALTGHDAAFRLFFEWFRNAEDFENQERRNRPDFRSAELEAVRAAVRRLLPGFDGLRIERRPLRMLLTKDGEELDVAQLSDGERVVLALASDIARRLALSAPGEPRPLEVEGVVLIDELELHLHPLWQRRILPALLAAFPNTQFIVTTHSPLILSELPPSEGSVLLVARDADGRGTAMPLDAVFGRDANQILEAAMGVDDRPTEAKRLLGEFLRMVGGGTDEEVAAARQRLADAIGADDPVFVKAETMLRTRELLRHAAHRQG